MTTLRITIPEGLDFEALQLARDPITGEVEFDRSPIDEICAASGIDPALFWQSPEDNLAGLIILWYAEHRARGGAPDPVQEQLLAEVQAEDEHGEHRVQRGTGVVQ